MTINKVYFFCWTLFASQLLNAQESKPTILLKSENADYYDFPFNSTITLGKGFDPNNVESVKLSPFTCQPDSLDGSASLKTTLEYYSVFTKEQLKKVLDVDVKLDARYLSASTNANINIAEHTDFGSSKLILVLKGFAEFGRIGLKGMKLTPEAISAENNKPLFREKYGTRFAVMERRASSVYIIISIEGLSEDIINKVHLQTLTKASGLIMSASLQMDIKKSMEKHHTEITTDVKILSTGGKGFTGIGKMVSSLKDDSAVTFETIKSTVGEYLENFTYLNAAPFGYYCVPYKNLGLNVEQGESLTNNQTLMNIVNDYRKYQLIADRIDGLLNEKNIYDQYASETEIKSLKEQLNKLYVKMDELDKIHKDLLNGKPGVKPELDESLLILPNLYIIYITKNKEIYTITGSYLLKSYVTYRFDTQDRLEEDQISSGTIINTTYLNDKILKKDTHQKTNGFMDVYLKSSNIFGIIAEVRIARVYINNGIKVSPIFYFPNIAQ